MRRPKRENVPKAARILMVVLTVVFGSEMVPDKTAVRLDRLA
jgi:hypothetical protein